MKSHTDMRLIIVRHGEPNYAIDSLTKKGGKEAKLLAKRMLLLNADYYYCSPLGRAKKTASYTMKNTKKELEILPFLKEFEGRIIEDGKLTVCWDRKPSKWTKEDMYYTDKWYDTAEMKKCDVKAKYQSVCDGIDSLLAKHGYTRENRIYRAVNPNHCTIVLFCHFAVECVILSHITGISPMILWHNFVALPTSVTTLITEEREKGVASFRIQAFGDISHLYAGGEEPSFAARFCECFDDNTRR